MEGTKLKLSGRPSVDKPASYKAIPEADTEEEAVSRPKSLVKSKPISPEVDGADEKMLPNEEKVESKDDVVDKQNGEAKLDIGDIKTAFVGLTKEELMKYANDPFWVRLRWFLFITFWILWGLMLLGSIIIICAAPKCDPPPPRTWWQKGPLTETNHEIKAEEVKSLKEKGVTGVILSWLEDAYIDFDKAHTFIESLKKFKDENLNVIVDIEPGTSQVWFNKSEHKDPEFVDYYIWRPPKSISNGESPEPPNNWLTVDSNSSWIYSRTRKEFYYAPRGRPHLNFRNPNVTERFSDVLKKFLEYDIGGIRLRGVPFLLVDPKFENEPLKLQATDSVLTDYGFYLHTKTENLMELGPLLKQWNVIVKNKTENGPFMVAEDLNKIEAYKVNNSLVVDLPLQSHLFVNSTINVSELVNALSSIFNVDNVTWPLWKYNSDGILDVVTYLLPGTPLISENISINSDLLKIRDSPSIMRGSFYFQLVNNGTIFAFTRVAAGNPGILVAVNPTKNHAEVDFALEIPNLSEEVTVQLLAGNYSETELFINGKRDAHKVPVVPESAIVLSYVPSNP